LLQSTAKRISGWYWWEFLLRRLLLCYER
jgi:hypothetical protein